MEPDDEIYANGEPDSSNNRNRPIINGEQLDIEAYAGLYTGRTKITRLLFIADQCGQNNNTAMQMEALRMAYEEIKKGENTQLFRDVVHKIDGRLGDKYGMDSAWCEAVDRRAVQKKEKLENELNAYRTNLIKESIRMGYNDFGDYHYTHGSLADAFKSYVRTRDYCTTSKHVIHMCMSAILVSIETGQFTHVTSYISKAEQTVDALDPNTVSKLHCAAGLAHLDSKKYKLAARKFLEVAPELGNSYNEVIAPQDVATYGGLCALASFDRMELKNKVIDSINFRNFLELVPEVRELIHDFYSSHYASCLDYLGNLKANLMLDIHLHDHVQTLYDQIRNKALIQYTHPFVSVDLHVMANAFKTTVAGLEKELEALITDNQIQTLYDQIRNKALIQYTHPFVSVDLHVMANAFKTTVAGLEKELEALITDNQIQARIDSHNKILYARHADQRNATFQRVLQTGNEFDRDVRAMLLRANLIKLEYKASRKL